MIFVNILGQDYGIFHVDYDKCPRFKEMGIDGYCDFIKKDIFVCNVETNPLFSNETAEHCAAIKKHILRHEIIHAFLEESGLGASSHDATNGWATNEEMIDWFATQFPKIYKVFDNVGCLF